MPMRQLTRFLDDNHVRYVRILHSPAFTAQEIAASAHVPGREMAKTVIVRVDDKLHMVVLPATSQVDLESLRRELDAHDVELAGEEQFRGKFPECELGAMPPFGNLFGMRVFVDRELVEDETIAFNAGSHAELLRMEYRDFARLAEPRVVDVSARVG